VPYPPRHGGAFNYTADLIDHLAELTELNVLCYDDPPDAARPRPGLFWTKLPRRRAPRWKSAVSSQPNIAEQFRQPAFIEAMLQLADAADAVILDHLAMAWCAAVLAHHFAARKGRRRRPPLLFIPHDHHKSVRHQAARQVRNPLMRALVTWDAIKATRLEHQAVELCDGVVVLTDADADQFRVEHPKTRYLTVQPGYNGRVVAQRSIDAAVPERICVLGGRGSFHKQIVLRQCLDALQRQGAPAPYVDVVGHIEDDLRSALQARYPSLNFLGFVDDIEDYLATVRLGVLPDAVGGGFKLRALTYAFNRVPMLAVKGALAGSGFTAGENYIETAQLDDLVNAARAVVGNFAELNRIQDNAFRYCESRFDWRRRAADLHTFAIGLRAEMPAPAC
jgi:glycosyltransferase involved in cell wall biosynthesis